jgi:hypothetical protein
MVQATGGMSANEMYVALSADGSTWTDVSGYANAVQISGGERQTGEVFTFDGNTPIVKYGKLGFLSVTISGVYTEEASKLYAMAKTAYEAGSALYARWSPGGGDSGDYLYTTSVGTVINPPYPGGSADTPDAILVEITMNVGSITQSTIPTGSTW